MLITLEHATMDWHEDFLAQKEADRLLLELSSWQWQRRTLQVYGKTVVEPRDTALFGETSYRYSGRDNTAAPWPESLIPLLHRVQEAAGVCLNSCLVNRYRDGQDSIALHRDNEPELGINPVIASVSLGVTRKFQVRGQDDKLDLDLTHGSLLVMRAPMQQHYRHGVPKQPKVTAPRFNLTFRWIHSV